MFLLGRQLPDNHRVKSALTSFYGLSKHLSAQLCARLQVHDTGKVGDLTDAQVTQLSAYLSSPGSIPARNATPTRGPLETSSASSSRSSSSSSSSGSVDSSSQRASTSQLPPSQRTDPSTDPLRSLVLESDLRRMIRANIAHHRTVGSYRGRRHHQGLPVRGQRTSSNAQTARKLNRVERRAFSTGIAPSLAAAESQSTASTSSSMWTSLASRFMARPSVSSLLGCTRSRPTL